MKFRISDNSKFAVEFESNKNDFKQNFLDAAKSFRLSTGKQFHDGATRQTKIYFVPGYLHIEGKNGVWFNRGTLKSTEKGMEFFEPVETPVLNTKLADNIDEVFAYDEFVLAVNSDVIWSTISDLITWGNAFDNFTGSIIDSCRSG